MIRTLSISLFAIAACTTGHTATTPGTDPLAGETGDGDSSKADAPHDNFTYVAVEKQGAFNCNNPLTCTPYQLTRVNRAQIECNDNQLHDNCLVKEVNFSQFSQDTQNTVNAALEAEAMDPTIGIQVLVKGQFKIYVDFLAYEASEVWVAQLPGGSTDATWVRLSDTGLRCFGNCAAVLEEKLNSNRSARIDGFDFGDSPDQSLEETAWGQEKQPDGVIVVGSRTNGVGQGPGDYTSNLRTVDQLFLPLN